MFTKLIVTSHMRRPAGPLSRRVRPPIRKRMLNRLNLTILCLKRSVARLLADRATDLLRQRVDQDCPGGPGLGAPVIVSESDPLSVEVAQSTSTTVPLAGPKKRTE